MCVINVHLNNQSRWNQLSNLSTISWRNINIFGPNRWKLFLATDDKTVVTLYWRQEEWYAIITGKITHQTYSINEGDNVGINRDKCKNYYMIIVQLIAISIM